MNNDIEKDFNLGGSVERALGSYELKAGDFQRGVGSYDQKLLVVFSRNYHFDFCSTRDFLCCGKTATG